MLQITCKIARFAAGRVMVRSAGPAVAVSRRQFGMTKKKDGEQEKSAKDKAFKETGPKRDDEALANRADKAEIEAIYKFYHSVLEAEKHKIVDTPEEQAHRRQVLRTANTESRKAHQKVERDLTNKIYLQQEAIKALPVEMQADAKMIDQTPYPMDRPWPRWDTPPIPGFNPLDYADKKKDSEENA